MKKKKKSNAKITLIFVLIFLILLLFCLYLKIEINKIEENNISVNVIAGNNNIVPKTIKEVIEKNDSKYVKNENSVHYVEFSKDLFDEKGSSNKEFFDNIVNEILELEEYQNRTFYLVDQEKNIRISIKFDEDTNSNQVVYNNIEDYFNKVDGDSYVDADTTEIVEPGYITIVSHELNQLTRGNMFFYKIDQIVGEGTPVNDKYTSYCDGAIWLKLLNGKVRNFIFTQKYQDEVANNVKVGTDLKDIIERYPNISGGSVNSGYIYYRTSDLYIFFYEDEISAYGYSYFENTQFEEFLEQYLSDNDLETFIQNVSKKWTNHDIYEYDPSIKYAHITFPSRGVEINIKDNNPVGITLYSNYYLTEKTKKFVKDGKITLEANEDLLLLTEIERRKNY